MNNTVFENFVNMLTQRFEAEVRTTEDSVRYTYFAALLEHGIRPEHVILEYPHPEILNAEIDTWIQISPQAPIALEFKYHRNPPNARHQAKTMNAGSLFRDIGRLRQLNAATNATCYFVYVTTREMAVYFMNSANGWGNFFSLIPESEMLIEAAWFENRPLTFKRKLGEPFNVRLTSVYSHNFPSDRYVRVFRIEAVD
jgi:hypothetical protein